MAPATAPKIGPTRSRGLTAPPPPGENNEHRICRDGPERFGETAERSKNEHLLTTPRGEKNRHRHAHALRKLVNADGQRCEKAHADQLVVVRMTQRRTVFGTKQDLDLLVRARFVQILRRGNHIAEQPDDENIRKKSRHDIAVARPGQRYLTLGENFDERNIKDHTRRQAGGEREKTVVSPLGQNAMQLPTTVSDPASKVSMKAVSR